MNSKLLICAAGAVACLVAAPAQARVSHRDCQIHGHRTYSHRHVEPNDRLVSCDRPVQFGRYPTTARCSAMAVRNGGAGPDVPGTLMAVEMPYHPGAPAIERADAMNAACAEASEACYHASEGEGGDIACKIIDQGFVR